MILQIFYFNFPFPLDPSDLDNPFYDYDDSEEDFD